MQGTIRTPGWERELWKPYAPTREGILNVCIRSILLGCESLTVPHGRWGGNRLVKLKGRCTCHVCVWVSEMLWCFDILLLWLISPEDKGHMNIMRERLGWEMINTESLYSNLIKHLFCVTLQGVTTQITSLIVVTFAFRWPWRRP